MYLAMTRPQAASAAAACFARSLHPKVAASYSNLMMEVAWLRRSLSMTGAGYERATFRLFLSQQLQKHLPSGIIFGFRESPFEDDQVFAV
jgi:hypothetical protein